MVRFVRAFPHSVEPGTDGTGVTIRYIDEKGDMHHEHFDMVVLSTGVEPPWETKRLARIFKVELDEHQFAITPYIFFVFFFACSCSPPAVPFGLLSEPFVLRPPLMCRRLFRVVKKDEI